MSDFENKIITGDAFALYGLILAKYLKKAEYRLTYNPDTETIILYGKYGGPAWEKIFDVRSAPYILAKLLASNLSLAQSKGPTEWEKCPPILYLEHNGTEGAEKVRHEILKSEVPLKVEWGTRLLKLGNFSHPSGWCIENDVQKMLDKVQEVSRMYNKQLSTTP